MICLAQFAVLFMFAGVGVSLPTMGADLGARAAELGMIETVYLGTSAALLLPAGRLADASDRATLFKWGLAVFVIATAAIGCLSSIDAIIALRLIQGAGSALLGATGMAILTESIPAAQRGRAIGWATGSVYAGLAVGPYLAGLMTLHLGWRWVYFVSAGILAVALAVASRHLGGHWQRPTQSIDRPSSVLISTAILALVFGGALLDHGALGIILLGASVGLAWGFWRRQRRIDDPLVRVEEIAGNPALRSALQIQFTTYAGAFGATFLYGIFLQIAQHYTPAQAGQALVLGPVLMMVLAPVSGRLADRFSAARLSALGSAIVLLSIVVSLFLDRHSPLWLLLSAVALQGVGFALFSTPNVAIIMSSVDKHQLGVASALTAMMRSVGMVLSMVVITGALALVYANAPIESDPQRFVDVMHAAFVAFAVVNTGAFLLGWRRANAETVTTSNVA